jgi:hypothetical protein
MINEEDLQIRLLHSPEPALSDAPPALQVPAPHRTVRLEGVLCCGRPTARRRAQISDIVLDPLTQLVSQVVEWSGPTGDADHYLGDYRFLVLSVPTALGTDAYVQIWSEPHDQLVMEVGPGNREDAVLQAFADGIRDSLLDRGFAIGGNANNYRKALPVPSGEDAPRVAREMLAILLDVVAYEGLTDLAYKFQQDSNLKDAHVLSGIDRSSLCMLLQRWGLRATPSAEDSTVIEATSLERKFQLQLSFPKTPCEGDFWEIHCLAMLTMAADEASSVVEKVNGRPYLIKAHVATLPGEPIQAVRLSVGINLAGGVTLGHIRAQISEFLQVVRKLYLDWQP